VAEKTVTTAPNTHRQWVVLPGRSRYPSRSRSSSSMAHAIDHQALDVASSIVAHAEPVP
jgi:hypothetical protein